MIICGYRAAFAKSTAKFVLHFKSVLILVPRLAPASEALILFSLEREIISGHCIIEICQKCMASTLLYKLLRHGKGSQL